jgi:hypothetical protein
MIKNAEVKIKFRDVNLLTNEELVSLLDRLSLAIASVHGKFVFDSNVNVDFVEPVPQVTANGKAEIDGFMKVQRASGGEPEHFYNVNGESHPITRAQYDAAHAAKGV